MSEHLASFAVLGAQALVPITIGSFQSLRVPAPVRARRRAARRSKNKLGLDDDDDDDILDEEEGETLTMTDSLLFPVMGSVALLGLWALIKYVDKKWLDIALGVYCEYHVGAGEEQRQARGRHDVPRVRSEGSTWL